MHTHSEHMSMKSRALPQNPTRQQRKARNGTAWCRSIVIHTNTTRGYVSSNHDGALASLEFVQNPVTLILLLISMDGYIFISDSRSNNWISELLTERRPAVLTEKSGDLVCDAFRACED